MQPTIDVIIVNWNSNEPLQTCLTSLFHSSCDNFAFSRIVVVDNSSEEDCREVVSRFPGVRLFHNASNLGFAAACNQGARYSDARYLLFLNPDTALRPDALAKVAAFVEQPGRTPTSAFAGYVCSTTKEIRLSAARTSRHSGHF